jgi:hypothetical protein
MLSCRNITLNSEYFPTPENPSARITIRTYSKVLFSRQSRGRFDQTDLVGVTNIAYAAKGAWLEVTTVMVRKYRAVWGQDSSTIHQGLDQSDDSCRNITLRVSIYEAQIPN